MGHQALRAYPKDHHNPKVPCTLRVLHSHQFLFPEVHHWALPPALLLQALDPCHLLAILPLHPGLRHQEAVAGHHSLQAISLPLPHLFLELPSLPILLNLKACPPPNLLLHFNNFKAYRLRPPFLRRKVLHLLLLKALHLLLVLLLLLLLLLPRLLQLSMELWVVLHLIKVDLRHLVPMAPPPLRAQCPVLEDVIQHQHHHQLRQHRIAIQ